jgi:hypothetical protein
VAGAWALLITGRTQNKKKKNSILISSNAKYFSEANLVLASFANENKTDLQMYCFIVFI